jgi:hypothetical protein
MALFDRHLKLYSTPSANTTTIAVLSDDLLVQIFSSEPLLGSPDDSISLASICTTCKRWHAIAISSAELWCRLHFETRREAASQRRILSIWIPRSKQRKLNVRLDSAAITDWSAMRLLIDQSHRYSSLHLTFSTTYEALRSPKADNVHGATSRYYSTCS